MEQNNKSIFETLNAINVNGMTEKKKQTNGTTLTYLNWSSAWQVVKEKFPGATYEIEKNPETGLPYWYDPLTGYMVFVKTTVGGTTYEMWLPVMDGTNHAMKDKPYTYDTKYKKGLQVKAASMCDINRTLMRALTKCLAMHGLGLYIYQGKDIPQPVEQAQPAQQPIKPIEKAAPQMPAQPQAQPAQAPVKDTRPVTPQMVDFIKKTLEEHQVPADFVCQKYKVSRLDDLKVYQAKHIGKNINRLKQMFDSEKSEHLAAIVKNSKPKDMGTTFADAILPQQPQEKTEGGEVSLESLGLSPEEMEALTECGNVFS